MLAVLLVAVAAPQPSPTPLKTITHVRVSPFCTTLRENVGHALKALIENDDAVSRGKSLFLKMAYDKVSSSAPTMRIDVDIAGLGATIDQMAKNLADVQAQLNDPSRFAPTPQTAEEKKLARIQTELRAIAARQNQALNVLSGTYFSYNGNRLMGAGDGMKAPVDPPDDPLHATPIVLPPIRQPSNPVPAPTAASSPSPRTTPPIIDMGLMGKTKFAALFNNLTADQVVEEQLEAQAAQTIEQSAQICNGTP